MGFVELLFLAFGLAMDAFAISICAGVTSMGATLKRALIIGLYFGIFQAVMPVIGYFAALGFSEIISGFDHWVVFALLTFIGGKMIYGSRKNDDCDNDEGNGGENGGGAEAGSGSGKSGGGATASGGVGGSLKPSVMLPLALATSIDALAVGVSFSILNVNIVLSALLIGAITMAMSMAGINIGEVFGAKYKSKAEVAGGIILIIIGIRILIEHLELIGYIMERYFS
ncbi:MAG: manganese efflux pump MntP family protein [Oscillospiraceae bacterium]|nr:manganese efflux pump MntP family protein [Oscillospiraceae bacterium]